MSEKSSDIYLPSLSGDRIPIVWSESRKEMLSGKSADPSDRVAAVEVALDQALLTCTTGDFVKAETRILQLLSKNIGLCEQFNNVFSKFVEALFIVQRFDLVIAMLRDKHGYSRPVKIDVRAYGSGAECVRWEISESGEHCFTFDATIFDADHTGLIILLFQWIFPLFAHYSAQPVQERGRLPVNLGDVAASPGLAFSDSRPDRFLVPDNMFVPNRGHRHQRQTFKANPVPWNDRVPVAFWRGSTTGVQNPAGDWRSLPRVRLCELQRQPGNDGLLDAAITAIVQFSDEETIDQIERSGLLGNFVPWRDWNKYKYQIDIDGNSNSWSAFFFRLLTGSPVLKVESSRGLGQWYYERLAPWKNYVPVAPDMSDLADKIRYLQRHDTLAEKIGQCGHALADEMTYVREMDRAMCVISAAFRYFAGVGGIAPFGRT